MKTQKENIKGLAPGIVALAIAGIAAPAAAVDFKLGEEINLKVRGNIVAGTNIRTESPDPTVYGQRSGPAVGLPPGQLQGNSGYQNLNFRDKYDAWSTVTKGLFSAELKYRDLGAFVSAYAWYDFELENGDRAYGNFPNGFTKNVPLGDNGFARQAQFSGAEFREAFVFGKLDLNQGNNLDLRLGRQVVRWGVAQNVLGGINQVNGIDRPAAERPGATLDETRVPVGMLYGNLSSDSGWGVDGWYQYEFRPGVLPGCGTFLAQPNFSPPGCNYVSVLGATQTDQQSLATNQFVHRAPDILARDSGQWGLSGRYNWADMATELRLYAMNFHARGSFIQVVNGNVPGQGGGFGTITGNLTRLTSPNGLKYQMVYPEDIKLYGFSLDSKPAEGLRLFGEFSYRPDQPLQLNASDLISAFYLRSPNSALNLAKGTNAIPPGGTFEGWDRYGFSMTTAGVTKEWKHLAGAERVLLTAEAGYAHVFDLPDPTSNLRYGRSDDYGQAQVTGGAPCVGNSKTCSLQGFVTSNAWGYRLRLAADYHGALFGATLTPSLLFTHDVKGYSPQDIFLEDRWILRPALRADWKQYYAEVQYWATGGGDYNTRVDRDYVSLFAGMRF
jgi:hypothetical protein